MKNNDTDRSLTGAERYFAERMKDPEYARSYTEALYRAGWRERPREK